MSITNPITLKPDNPMVPSRRSKRLPRNVASRVAPRSISRLVTASFIAFLVSATTMSNVDAKDWPQINGPNRNGVAANETLLQTWPADGLKEVWSHPIGQGNAGPVVIGETLIIFHRPAKKYLVEALNAKSGRLIWNQELEAQYTGGHDGDLGPKSVPLIHNGYIYLLGAGGNLFCLKLEDGSVVWKKNVLTEYRGQPGYFGAGSTPIVVDQKLILNVGGKNAAVVAFDLESGDELWKTFDDDASYSSPVEVILDGESVVVFITRLNMIGLNPADGKLLFQTPFGKSGPTVNAAMPVSINLDGQNFLFVSAAYGVGARWLAVSKDKVEKQWGNDDSFSSQYSTPVFSEGFLYGTAGREDYQNGSYRCIDATDGKVMWKKDGFPVGHSLLVGKQILVLDCDGGFHVLTANKSKFDRVFQTKLFDSKSRALPALHDGLFYARSNAGATGQGELVCVEVGSQKK